MSHPDASFWDERYSNDAKWRRPRLPRNLVTSHLELLPRDGLVLDVACGTTSTGMHLAGYGWRVVALDVSNAALRIAQAEVRKEALPVSFALMDLTDPWLPSDHFDVILNLYYLSRPLMRTYRTSIKPGGLLFFETFLREENFSSDVDGNPEHYLYPLELKDAFKDWQIIDYAETQRNDRPGRARKIAQLVARRPFRKEEE
jgi:SAM-dependent methyltransferase